MGAGMAALQVAINPLLRVAGGEAHFAFNSAFAQLVFGAASFLSPLVYAYLVTRLGAGGQPSGALLGLLARVTPVALALGVHLLAVRDSPPWRWPSTWRR